PTETRIDVLASLDRLIECSGMSNHVRVRRVNDEYIRFAFVDRAQKLVSDFERGHLRHQIVSRHFRRRHEQTLLMPKFVLGATVEKISYVRVLFSLSQTKVFYFINGNTSARMFRGNSG